MTASSIAFLLAAGGFGYFFWLAGRVVQEIQHEQQAGTLDHEYQIQGPQTLTYHPKKPKVTGVSVELPDYTDDDPELLASIPDIRRVDMNTGEVLD